MKLLPLLCLTLIPNLANADFVITKKAVYKVENGELVKISTANDKVCILTNDSTPGPDPEPEPETFIEQIKLITRTHIQSKKEAEGLLAVVRLLKRPDVKEFEIEKGLTRAIEVLSAAPLFPGNKFKDWLTEVKSLKPKYNRNTIEQIDTAVISVFRLESGTLETREDIQSIAIPELIQLIQLIFELLKNLGVFAREATLVASAFPACLLLIPALAEVGYRVRRRLCL